MSFPFLSLALAPMPPEFSWQKTTLQLSIPESQTSLEKVQALPRADFVIAGCLDTQHSPSINPKNDIGHAVYSFDCATSFLYFFVEIFLVLA